MEDDEVIDTIDAIHFKLLMVEASPAFAVPLLVLVVNDRDGVQHRGTLQLPRRAPAAPGRRESPLPARLHPLMRALGNALLFLPAVMTTSGRISRDFLRLLYILSDRQAVNYFTRMGILDSSTKAYKQRRGTYFYSRLHRRRLRPGHCHEDRHRPTQTPSQKAHSPSPRPQSFPHPSIRPPP